MRLLLDEHLDRHIAGQLRARGFDVFAVTEDPKLMGSGDREILERALQDRRTIVIYDVHDFRIAVDERVALQEPHFGVIFLSTRKYPQGKRHVGALIGALAELLARSPAEDALADREIWL